MADRPILFSAPMVRGLIREVEHPGTGKTQTRRIGDLVILNDDPSRYSFIGIVGDLPYFAFRDLQTGHEVQIPCRFKKGDRLWVRETVACGACAPSKPSHWAPSFWRREQGTPKNPNGLWYAADDLAPEKPITKRGRWVPGIHMPRWASRLTLTVTDVRVQRLQEISEEDAIAEGIEASPTPHGGWRHYGERDGLPGIIAVDSYRTLWDHINGAGSWAANPWIVALTFTVERRNIDT